MARFLLVDDNAQVRSVLATILRVTGHEVTTAEDGHEALAHIQVENFDVVLTDVEMPGMDGLTLLNRARKVRPELRVLVMSGSADRELVERSGAAGYLSKPFTTEHLLSRVEEVRAL